MKLLPCSFITFTAHTPLRTDVRIVQTASALRKVLTQVKSGDRIRLEPGSYGHGFRIEKLSGPQALPIMMEGAEAG